MKKLNIIITTFITAGLLSSCNKQLNVKNPNNPTPQSASTEKGIISLAQGSIYTDGFTSNGVKYYDGVMGAFFAGVNGFHSIMGDEVDDEAANEYMNQIGCPYSVTLEDGTVIINNQAPQKQPDLIRQVNQNSYSYNNPLYYEWAYMYNLNNSANYILSLVDNITFGGDADTKKNTLKAWAYWWKGYAYSRIGSMYYAGIINNTPAATNNKYVTKEDIITEANANFDKAATILGGLSNNSTYSTLLGQLIPSIFQVGKGLPPTPDMWVRNINTYKARNILANTTVASMSAAQWSQVLTLTNNGIKADDDVFTARSNANSDFISFTSGTVASKAVGDPASLAAYIIQERLVEDFKTGDLRFKNNFQALDAPYTYPDRGIALGTRWMLLDGGNGISGTAIFGSRSIGDYELFMACSYEENELMKAEAKIYTGDITGGLSLIDEVRTYQGAGLAPVAGTTQDAATAKEELRKERRIGLMFRGLAFYDARRWEVITNGRKNAWFVDNSGKFHPSVTINYDYLDYWDVPDNELAYNAPSSDSAPVKNPK